jgi:hypothetical protein
MDQDETKKTAIAEVNSNDLFKDLVWSAIVKAATAALIRAIPFLGMGPMGAVTGLIVGLFGDFLYAQLKDVYNFHSIGIANETHRREFDNAGIKLKLLARDKGIESNEFKEAKKRYGDDLAKFIRFAG